MKDYALTYLSLGAGVQSTALLICSALGLHGVPRADVAIFADTGDEPAWVYEHLWKLAEWSPIPIHIAIKGHLSHDVLSKRGRERIVSVPVWTVGTGANANGVLRRQCTREYKIEPIERHVRRLLGLVPRARIKVRVRCLLGISLDECDRMRPSRAHWIDNAFPLIDARLKRRDCERIAVEQFGYAPKKSSCVYCPYHSDLFWKNLKVEHPEEFERAAHFDDQVRDMSMAGVKRPVYLHRSLIPLREIDFGESNRDFFTDECSGTCGV